MGFEMFGEKVVTLEVDGERRAIKIAAYNSQGLFIVEMRKPKYKEDSGCLRFYPWHKVGYIELKRPSLAKPTKHASESPLQAL